MKGKGEADRRERKGGKKKGEEGRKKGREIRRERREMRWKRLRRGRERGRKETRIKLSTLEIPLLTSQPPHPHTTH